MKQIGGGRSRPADWALMSCLLVSLCIGNATDGNVSDLAAGTSWWREMKPVWASRVSQQPRTRKYFLMSCVMMRGELHLLRETVVRTMMAGVEHTVVVHHDPARRYHDEVLRVIHPLIANGLVTVVWTRRFKRQLCITGYRDLAHWILYIDADEVLTELQPERHSLVRFLEELPSDVPALHISSHFFLSNGRLEKAASDMMLLDAFTEYCPWNPWRVFGKIIVRPELVTKVWTHNANYVQGAGLPVDEDGLSDAPLFTTEERRKFLFNEQFRNMSWHLVRSSKFAISHYWCRSAEVIFPFMSLSLSLLSLSISISISLSLSLSLCLHHTIQEFVQLVGVSSKGVPGNWEGKRQAFASIPPVPQYVWWGHSSE